MEELIAAYIAEAGPDKIAWMNSLIWERFE